MNQWYNASTKDMKIQLEFVYLIAKLDFSTASTIDFLTSVAN